MENPRSIKVRGLLFLLFASFFLSSCNGPQVPPMKNSELKGSISISGAFALYPLVSKLATEFMILHPGVRIDLSAGGAGKGLTDVLSQQVDIAMYSLPLSENVPFYITIAKDAVVPVIATSCPFRVDLLNHGLTRENLLSIFLRGKVDRQGELADIESLHKFNVYSRSDICGAAEVWANFLGVHQNDLIGVKVFGDKGLVDAIERDPLGIGYVNMIYAYDLETGNASPKVTIVPIDFNGNGKVDSNEDIYLTKSMLCKSIESGVYPEPPARSLYLIANEKPTNPIVKTFLEFALKQGQVWVKDLEYVRLSDEQLQRELSKLSQLVN